MENREALVRQVSLWDCGKHKVLHSTIEVTARGPDTWTTQKLAATVFKLNPGIEAHSDRE